MKPLNILVAFECSGKVRDAFRRLGHDATSLDLQKDYSGTIGRRHLVVDFSDYIDLCHKRGRIYDIIIMHPPCTALACSGNRWYGKGQPRHQERLEALEQTKEWWTRAKNLAPHVALKNPVGVLWNFLGIEPNYVQPWQFGHGETKRTGLWLHNLPELQPTNVVEGREQRVWKMPPSEERERLRSETYQGIADAMAQQWSEYILTNREEVNDND